MNFEIPMFNNPNAFELVLIITGVSVTGGVLFFSFLWFFK